MRAAVWWTPTASGLHPVLVHRIKDRCFCWTCWLHLFFASPLLASRRGAARHAAHLSTDCRWRVWCCCVQSAACAAACAARVFLWCTCCGQRTCLRHCTCPVGTFPVVTCAESRWMHTVYAILGKPNPLYQHRCCNKPLRAPAWSLRCTAATASAEPERECHSKPAWTTCDARPSLCHTAKCMLAMCGMKEAAPPRGIIVVVSAAHCIRQHTCERAALCCLVEAPRSRERPGRRGVCRAPGSCRFYRFTANQLRRRQQQPLPTTHDNSDAKEGRKECST